MTWRAVGQMQKGRRQHAVDFLSPSELLIFAGFKEQTAEIYNLDLDRSRFVAEIDKPANTAVSVNPDGRGPSYFGFREGGENSDKSQYSRAYRRESNTWVKDLDFGLGVAAPKTAVIADGSVMVTGGAVKEQPFITSRHT